MARIIEIAESVAVELGKLDEGDRLRIMKFLEQSAADPLIPGAGPPGASRLGNFWKLVGASALCGGQLICKVEQKRMLVLTIRRITC